MRVEWMNVSKKKKKWRNLRNAFHMGRFLKSIHPFEELERSRSYSPRLRLWKKKQGRLFVSTEQTPGPMCLPLSPWVNQQHLLGFLFRATRTGSLGKSFSMAEPNSSHRFSKFSKATCDILRRSRKSKLPSYKSNILFAFFTSILSWMWKKSLISGSALQLTLSSIDAVSKKSVWNYQKGN